MAMLNNQRVFFFDKRLSKPIAGSPTSIHIHHILAGWKLGKKIPGFPGPHF